MKIPYFCCIGAELKRYEKDFDFMNQVYLYKIPADDTLEEVLAQDYFLAVADSVLQDDLLYIYEPTAQVLYTCRFNKQAGHITAVQLANNVPGLTPNRVLISDATGRITAGDVTLEYLKNKVNLDGTSIMTGPLKFVAGSLRGGIGPTFGGVEFYTLNNDSPTYSLVTLGRFSTNGFLPHSNNTYDIGSTARYWKDAYIARVITAVLNNGYDIAVPATAQPETLALKSEVDLAANSGRMITDEGVWYAKMYAASTVPTGAEYDGKNYADFSQVDSDNNPVIKIYTGANGAWTLTETITPPADYDGYVPITSKIWDILDQTGQQGGRVLWNHQTKTFTPYPQIISFDNQQITNSSFSGGTITSSTFSGGTITSSTFDGEATLSGVSTAPTPTASSPNNQIANKEYVAQIALPAGILAPFAGSSAPAGWLVCDGSEKSRTDYADLFAAIGTTYGAGDGSTTFNLPTQSVLPLGTQATVTRKSNADVWIAYRAQTNNGAQSSYSTGTYAKMQISTQSRLANKYQTSGGFADELLSLDPNGGLIVDLSTATGAQAIVCIKY